MLRVAILVGLLAGCSAHAHGPAWPKPAKADGDGGESLAPRPTAAIAIEESADVTPAEPIADKVDKPIDKARETPVVAPPVVPPTGPEQPIDLPDTTIEINEGD
jgi:hypothetical protein